MDSVYGLLPLLLFAVCPLMMMFCFFSMRKMGCATESAPANSTTSDPVQNLSPVEQIAALQMQLSQLQFEQMAIARQIDDLAGSITDREPAGNDSAAAVPAGSTV